MKHTDRMLAAIRGEATDRIPWAPRLDLWYKANRRADTLPRKYRNASLAEMTDDLDVGFHAVIPDYRDLRSPADDLYRGLGVYNIHTMPVRTVFENVRVDVRTEGDRTHVAYETPAGRITTTVVYTEAMRAAGVTITHVSEYPFKDARDYEALGYLFENARVESNADGYDTFAERVGDRGIAVGYVKSSASPMHLIQRDLMPLDTFFYEMHDRPDELARLAARIGVYWNGLLATAADSRADVLLLGANYDASVQYPPFFAEHIAPGLRRFADILHARGKFLLTHTDGENRGLLGHYLDAGFDVADSICPKPMTSLAFREVRDAFAGRITIMGGIPSVTLLPESMSERDFDAFLDGFFGDVGLGDHLILGVSDTTPPAADFNRILKIGERVDAFGPVRAA